MTAILPYRRTAIFSAPRLWADRGSRTETGTFMHPIELWNTQHFEHGEIFEPLRRAAAGLPQRGWPDIASVNALAQGCGARMVNARGEALRFVEQRERPVEFAARFEPSTFLRGEVLVRPYNWHDLFNALVWMTFPRAKAALNARHFAAMSAGASVRSPVSDALTHFDEDGVLVLSADATLLELLRDHQWKALFIERRNDVRARMKFIAFGHALFDKARAPFVGLTGKAILLGAQEDSLSVQGGAKLDRVDSRLAAHFLDESVLLSSRELAPLPVLGVPGWWPPNEDPSFYDNAAYFRPLGPRSPSSSNPA
jgi:hypothetical protein